MNENCENKKKLSLAEYFVVVQKEYLISEFKRKIYSCMNDKRYYSKVMSYKEEKIADISSRNNLKNIFNDKQTLKSIKSELFDCNGQPLFYLNEDDLNAYYTIGVDFNYNGEICKLIDVKDNEIVVNLAGKVKKLKKGEIFRIF